MRYINRHFAYLLTSAGVEETDTLYLYHSSTPAFSVYRELLCFFSGQTNSRSCCMLSIQIIQFFLVFPGFRSVEFAFRSIYCTACFDGLPSFMHNMYSSHLSLFACGLEVTYHL